MGASALLALAIGSLVLRTSGVYFIMVTLAFAQMLYFVFHDTKIAGGSDGIYIYVRPVAELFGWAPFSLEKIGDFYYLTLVCAAGVFAGLTVMLRSPFGRVIVGIRVNEHRMRSLGYATFRYKLVCFVIAGALAGLAGYLAAAQHGNVNPDMMGWHLSGGGLMMVILGGMGTLTGPIVGAFAMLMLEIAFQGMTKHWQLLMGGFIVLVALFLPRGLIGLAAALSAQEGDERMNPRGICLRSRRRRAALPDTARREGRPMSEVVLETAALSRQFGGPRLRSATCRSPAAKARCTRSSAPTARARRR